MKIAESTIQMHANRQAWQMGSRGAVGATGATSFQGIASAFMGTQYDAYLPKDGNGKSLLGNPYNKNGIAVSDVGAKTGLSNGTTASSMQYNLVEQLWQRMMQSLGIFSANTDYNSQYVQQIATYEEYESTYFQATGQAITEDGRQIDFNIEVSMSRSYREFMMVDTPLFQNLLMDPLVVNVSSDTLDVSDQTFFFDLDGDGIEEEINQLGPGSGFLALDKNGDGKINDGTELFGTQTGDAFGDLRAYDSDGNGWIDENDEIFEKLRIWCKDENGNDILMNLKNADVGAIYLGEQKSQFSMSDIMGGLSAVVQSTGIFIRESGTVSTVQHVDMAVHEDAEAADVIPVEVVQTTNGETNTNSNYDASDHTSQTIAKSNRAEDNEEVRRKQSEAEKKNMEARRARRQAERKALNEAALKRREENKEIMERNIERARNHQRRWKEHISREQLETAYGVI
ncbi:MAG: hypothetical protein K6A05_01985 [Lachnospiraceae bacterium]|nr:hypothetical protein [Lachnospiraceae bacterium]